MQEYDVSISQSIYSCIFMLLALPLASTEIRTACSLSITDGTRVGGRLGVGVVSFFARPKEKKLFKACIDDPQKGC